MGKVWVPISQVLPIGWVLLHFPRTIGNWWENPRISHMMKYTIGWESNGKKVPILWEKSDYQFPRFSPYDGFCCIFPYYGKLMGKPMHFPYDEVYHRMGIRWEKTTLTMGEVWLPISQVFPIQWVLLHFPVLWEIDGKTHAFSIWWSIPQDGNRMGKKYPYCGKSMITNLPGSPIRWVLLHFPMLWEIDGKSHAFPIW